MSQHQNEKYFLFDTEEYINFVMNVLSDDFFKALSLDAQFGIIRSIENYGDDIGGKSEAEARKKAKPYRERAQYLRGICKVFRYDVI